MDMESVVEKYVEKSLQEMDIESIITEKVRQMISEGSGKIIVARVSDAANEMMDKEIRRMIDSGVHTDNGWGDRKTYESFEDLFRDKFKSAITDNYKTQGKIARLVKERVDSLMQQDLDKAIEKVVDAITKSKLKKS